MAGHAHPALHDQKNCKGGLDDVEEMKNRLLSDPPSLERPQNPPQFCGHLTPLQSAVHVGHELCARFLLESGAQVDAWNDRGYTALYVATYAFEPTLVSLLLRYGACPNYLSRDSNITTEQMGHSKSWYLYLACSFGFLDIARSLVQHGAAPEEFWSNGFSSAAQVSSLKNHPECLLLALKYGAATDFHQFQPEHKHTGLKYYSLLHYSIEGKSFSTKESVDKVIKIWDILKLFGAHMWFKDFKQRTVLDRLVRKEFPLEQAVMLESNLKRIMTEPQKLSSLSRIVIRQSMGVDCHKNIKKLTCLPTPLIGFLNFEDWE